LPWSDRTTPIAEIAAAVHRFNEDRDWARYHCPRNMAMALCTEAAELLELYLWSADEGPQPPVAARTPQVAEEAADVLICLLALCDRAEIDLAEAVQTKLAKNAQRYPVEKAHGRLEKASELD
jgi:NTP pyrophosphatase (non-canonical NTP hydrolase)